MAILIGIIIVYVYGRCFTVALRCVVTVVQRNGTPSTTAVALVPLMRVNILLYAR